MGKDEGETINSLKYDNADKIKRWSILVMTFALNFISSFDSSLLNGEFVTHKKSISNGSANAVNIVEWLDSTSLLGHVLGSLLIAGFAIRKTLDLRKLTQTVIVHMFLKYCLCILYFTKPCFFPTAVAGQLIGGIGKSAVFSLTSSVGILWLTEYQIGKALGVHMVGMSVGNLLGRILNPLYLESNLLKSNNSLTGNISGVNIETNTSMYHFAAYNSFFIATYCILAVISLGLLFSTFFIIFSFPKVPPSLSQRLLRKHSENSNESEYNQKSIFHEIRNFFTEVTTISIAVQFGFLYYTFELEKVLINPVVENVAMLLHYKLNIQLSINFALGLYTFGSSLGAIVAGKILDHLKQYSIQSCVASALSCVFAVGMFLSSYYKNFAFLCTSLTLFSFFLKAGAITLLDSMHQHTHPSNVMFISSMLSFFHSSQVIATAGVGLLIFSQFGVLGISVLQCALVLICFAFSLLTNPQLRRLEVETGSSEPFGISTEESRLLEKENR